MKFSRRSCAYAIVIAILGAAPLAGQAQNNSPVVALQDSLQKAIAGLEPSLVPVVGVGKAGPLIVGTGFLVSRGGEFVTALHVLKQGPGVEIKALLAGKNGERQLLPVELVASDEPHELALCRVVLPGGQSAGFVPVTLAPAKDVAPGTLVVVSGFPLAAPNSTSHLGMVSSRTAEADPLEIAAFINEGESGAPVLRLDDGAVLGMVSSVRTASTYFGAGRGVEEQNSGLALAARSEWIIALMSRVHDVHPRPTPE